MQLHQVQAVQLQGAQGLAHRRLDRRRAGPRLEDVGHVLGEDLDRGPARLRPGLLEPAEDLFDTCKCG